MSTPESISPGATLGSFKLLERLGNTVWRADDSRTGKTVAIKILANRLPSEPARRESAIRDVRLAAVLPNLNLAPIDEVTAAGDALVMVMPLIDGVPVSKLAVTPASRETFFRIAWQLNAALKFLHDKGIVHGNVSGDSVLVSPTGEVKLVGMNLSNLLPRREGAARSLPDDVRKVAYMAPEQITSQPLEPRTDLFSAGVVFYQLATGRLPYQETNPSELARKIVSDPPGSPKAANPSIDNAVMGVLGRCLFKDPSKRYRDARMLAEDISKVDPEVAKWCEELSRRNLTVSRGPAAGPQAETREAILFLADIANYDDLAQRDPELAAKSAAKMQQVLGEAVYLFDGQVIDPFGPRMVAELPTVEAALEAARKGEFDVAPDQIPGSDMLHVRLLLHAGPVITSPSSIKGEAVDKAGEVLDHLQPLQLFITEDFVKKGRGNVRLRDAAARAGVKLFTIVAPEKEIEPSSWSESDLPVAEEVTTGDAPAPQAAGAMMPPPATVPPRKRSKGPLIAVVAGLTAFAAGGFFVWQRHAEQPAAPVAAATQAPVPVAKKIYIAPITAEPPLAPRAEAIRLTAIEMLKRMPDVELTTSPGADAIVIESQMKDSPTGTELTIAGTGAPVLVPDAASGVHALIEYAGGRLSRKPSTPASPAVLNAVADALTAKAANDSAKTDSAVRAAIAADPAYLPAQLFALEYFNTNGSQKDALDAARNVFAADPNNTDAARRVARASLGIGDVQQALRGYGAVLKRTSADPEALNVIAQYALASGDPARFTAALTKLKAIPQRAVAVHQPDSLVAAGRIEAAINSYYDIEVQQPDNAALALKIGRISVLRRSVSIAELEVKKLEQLDPIYSLPLLRAYVAAEKQDRPGAMKALEEAGRAAQASDAFFTSSAEVYAIFNDTRGVLDSLEKAAARKEPTGSYVLASPLFRYLQNDARFMQVANAFKAQQEEIRTALAQVGM
jgi:hypothetical protein